MTTIGARLQVVRARIAAAARAVERAPGSVRLVAVSKTVAPEAVREAMAAGQSEFGESYVAEALDKMGQLADLPITWHFIGPIQSNKTRAIAEHFTWVHGVDREKIAERLAHGRPPALPPLEVCVQVNVSGEDSKSGVAEPRAAALARFVRTLSGLRLRGLMTIPRPTPDDAERRAQFAVLRRLLEQLNAEGMALDTLSMGMSEDMEAAVAEGATIVRIGTAIFGERKKN
jgi:PLP dependent protein